MPKVCCYCQKVNAVLKRPRNGDQICKACFFNAFETEIHQTIIDNQLFKPGERVVIAASGGKDSTVLAEVMTVLNERYNYGLDLFLLSIDEGITGYRDDSLETVKRNQQQYKIPLKILSYKDLYNWSMDEIVKEVGLKNNCTFCGVFRRQALDRGSMLLKADKMVTGHNADDIAETILLNLLRGDIARLSRCTNITTGLEEEEQDFEEGIPSILLPRCKPFKYTYEKEIVMYAYFKKLDYFSTECTYAPNAYRGFAREFLKDLEFIRPESVLHIIESGERLSKSLPEKTKNNLPSMGKCERCGYMSSNKLCKACVLLEGLNKGTPKIVVGGNKAKKFSKQEKNLSKGMVAHNINLNSSSSSSSIKKEDIDF